MIDVSSDQLQTIKKILKHQVPDYEVRAFGSRFKWTAKDYSDLDLAIVGPEKVPFRKLSDLKTAFEESDLSFRVDVLDWHALSQKFQQIIEQGYEVIQKPGSSVRSMGWKNYIFSNFVTINPTVSLDSLKEYSFVEMKDLNENNKYVYPSTQKKPTGGARFQENDTLFARITPCLENGKICQVKKLKNGVGFGSTEFLVFRGKAGISDNNFVYYLSRFSEVRRFAEQNMLGTSGRQRVTREAFDTLELELPPLPIQRRIAEILSALDDKIELNRQTNATLEAITQTIFKEWFVDFNFPGGNGEMIESELGMIPKGWRVGKLEEMITNFDSKRVPLSSQEREKRKGIYPYYGAASIVDYIDDYLFDGVYLLMGEDGTVITNDEKPILQYVSGKLWVNNHTHVLQGKNLFSTEFVLLQLKNTNIKSIVTGAVQPKINQGNMNNLLTIIPDMTILNSFQEIIRPFFDTILETERENSSLFKIRDALLPKLVNGEINLPN
jgi:type I restriction enzyme S subunit